jgi:hypothetical protein
MKPIFMLLSVLIIFSIWISPVCSISINPDTKISAATGNQATLAPALAALDKSQLLTSPIDRSVLNPTSEPAPSKPEEMSVIFDRYYLDYDLIGADIYCFRGSDSNYAGIMSFYDARNDPGGYWRIEENVPSGKFYPHIWYPISRFNDVLNILRYTNASLELTASGTRSGLRAWSIQVDVTGSQAEVQQVGVSPSSATNLLVCPAGMVKCVSQCKDVSSDINNCGGCGHVCQAGSDCINGACTVPAVLACQAGLVKCGSQCMDVSSDINNCGRCGHVCQAGSDCTYGVCTAR